MPSTPRRASSTAPAPAVTSLQEQGCVFCAIVSGRAPAHRLLEDGHTVSFLNIAPAMLGHALVVPRYRADELQVMWQATPVADADLAAVRARTLGSAR
jgi:diadenosine tetraphosphate (Ap4A) HIT family hydrolase